MGAERGEKGKRSRGEFILKTNFRFLMTVEDIKMMMVMIMHICIFIWISFVASLCSPKHCKQSKLPVLRAKLVIFSDNWVSV